MSIFLNMAGEVCRHASFSKQSCLFGDSSIHGIMHGFTLGREVNPYGLDSGLNGLFVHAWEMSVHVQTLKYRFVFRLLQSPRVTPSIRAVGNFYWFFHVGITHQTTINLGCQRVQECICTLCELESVLTNMQLHSKFDASVWSSLHRGK